MHSKVGERKYQPRKKPGTEIEEAVRNRKWRSKKKVKEKQYAYKMENAESFKSEAPLLYL